MPTINEIQIILQEKTGRRITYTEIGDIIGTGRSNISLRAKNNSQATDKEMQLLENFYNISLTQTPEDCAIVPIRGDVTASMGAGVEVYNESQTGTYHIGKKLLIDIGASLDQCEMIFAQGDSMEPTIVGGDSLLVDLSKTEIYDGKIYCVRIENKLYAKRLQLVPPNKVKVISDNNEKYDPFYVDFSKNIDYDFAVVGEVKWWSRVAR